MLICIQTLLSCLGHSVSLNILKVAKFPFWKVLLILRFKLAGGLIEEITSVTLKYA